jgi:hypothetical protein
MSDLIPGLNRGDHGSAVRQTLLIAMGIATVVLFEWITG